MKHTLPPEEHAPRLFLVELAGRTERAIVKKRRVRKRSTCARGLGVGCAPARPPAPRAGANPALPERNRQAPLASRRRLARRLSRHSRARTARNFRPRRFRRPDRAGQGSTGTTESARMLANGSRPA
jgi:hypothetical protein